MLVLLLLFLFGAACGGTTPPGPDMAGGSYEDLAGYTYLRWPDGARLLFWHGVGDGGCNGSGSTGDPVYRVACRIELENGRLLTWNARTEDGETIELAIDGVPYDVAAGNVFLLDASGAGTAVTQLQRDLSALDAMHDDVIAFARDDAEIAAFLTADK